MVSRRRATIGFAITIAIGSWAISYSTQVEVALRHGFGLWQAGGWPACTEAAALAVMLLLVSGEIRRGLPAVVAWALVAACLAFTTWINYLGDPGDLIGAVMHSWAPVLSVAVFLLLVHGRPILDRDHVHQETSQGTPHETGRVSSPATVRRRVQHLLSGRPDVTSGEAARRLGISRSHAARLLREARTPHVIDETKAS